MDQTDLTDMNRAHHPLPVAYTLFSNIHATFFKIDHMWGLKKNGLPKTGVISGVASEHNDINIDISSKKTEKIYKCAIYTFLNLDFIKEQILKGTEKYLKKNENLSTHLKILDVRLCSSKRIFHSNRCLHVARRSQMQTNTAQQTREIKPNIFI